MTVRLYTEQDLLELTDEQAARLVAAGLAYPNQTLSGVDDEDGTLRAVEVYAYPGWDVGHHEDNLLLADRWMYQDGDSWMAVGPGESEDDWFEDTDRDRTWTPRKRVRDIHDLPEFGTLTYVRFGPDGPEPVEDRPVDAAKGMLVVAFITDGLTKAQITDLRAAVCAQGEASGGTGLGDGISRPDLHTFDVEVPFTVSTQEELHGILEVGAGL